MKSIIFPFPFLFNYLTINITYCQIIVDYLLNNLFRFYTFVYWRDFNTVSLINYSNTNALQIKYIH